MTLVEEDPEYRAKVAAYLAKSRHGRRLPWGCILAGGHLTFTTTSAQRTHRAELGETAIRLLMALGVTSAQLEALDEASDGLSPLELIQKLEDLQRLPAEAPVAPEAEAPPPVELGA